MCSLGWSRRNHAGRCPQVMKCTFRTQGSETFRTPEPVVQIAPVAVTDLRGIVVLFRRVRTNSSRQAGSLPSTHRITKSISFIMVASQLNFIRVLVRFCFFRSSGDCGIFQAALFGVFLRGIPFLRRYRSPGVYCTSRLQPRMSLRSIRPSISNCRRRRRGRCPASG